MHPGFVIGFLYYLQPALAVLPAAAPRANGTVFNEIKKIKTD
ncbi:MAG: hypothetical protein RBQ94_02890 [Methanimicrococcus sp.]|nr:hypothetical protein [Methanimicrococcus sp.]